MTITGSAIEFRELIVCSTTQKPTARQIHSENWITCNYCRTRHKLERCPSCGAPYTHENYAINRMKELNGLLADYQKIIARASARIKEVYGLSLLFWLVLSLPALCIGFADFVGWAIFVGFPIGIVTLATVAVIRNCRIKRTSEKKAAAQSEYDALKIGYTNS